MSPTQKTHNIIRIFYQTAQWSRAQGAHPTEPVELRIHVSRTCDNCTHFAPVFCQEWDVEAGGPCMDLVYPAGPGLCCHVHQSREEFEAGTYMIDRPVLTLVKGGSPC